MRGKRSVRPSNCCSQDRLFGTGSNYKGHGGIFGDFLSCVRTRERPFRDIELGHRTATLCHLGNIAYWLKRWIRWDPEKEEIVGDPEASRWLDRSMREPWTIG